MSSFEKNQTRRKTRRKMKATTKKMTMMATTATRSEHGTALDSNGLRVLCRVGFAEEQKNYSATSRLVQDVIREQLPAGCDSLIRAHQLLRQHGQELCKRSKPLCAECPLSDSCNY